jgi:phosphoribosylformylglycinamidine synthase
MVLEFGPRNSFASAFSSNATSIASAIRLPIDRLERSTRYQFTFASSPSEEDVEFLCGLLHDRMTEERYYGPVTSFELNVSPKRVEYVNIMEEGRKALEKINGERGLGFDEFDLDFYTELFRVSCCV